MAVDYGSLPFLEALAFLRAKTNLPTNRWDDLLGNAHDRAFVVAGATAADLLADLRGAVEGSIADGTTLEAFRRQFEDIVHQRGWTGWTGEDTAGGRAWRAQVIYETNLYTSYAAGRHEQMKDVAAARPYWRYRHSHASEKPRAEHLAWDGIILRHDDPWWATHAPPNGFGCFLAGTEVATPSGWRALETLRPGDQVIGGSGNVQTVDAPQVRPFEGEMVWIATEQGEVAATPNHRFLTLRGWIRAESLEAGEMLVQIPQVSCINHTISDVQQANASRAQFGVTRPLHGFQASDAEALNPHVKARDEEINPVGEKAAVMNRIKAPVGQLLQKQRLNSRGGSAGVNVGRGVLLMKFSLGMRHFGAHFRAKCGRRSFQLFSRSSRSLIRFLGFSLARMTAFCRLQQRGLAQNLGGLLSPGVVVDPLNPNPLLVVAGGDAKPFHQPHHRAVVASPTLAKAGDRPSLFEIQDPEGFVSGAPLDGFNSLKDFCGWARAHGVISKVVSVRRQLHIGNVYNLSISGDASYCLRLGVVHNCKCYIETLAARDLEREGVKVSPRPFDGTYQWENPQTGKLERLPNGVDPGWNYAPGASVYQDQVKLRQELADKVADLNAEWRTATREDPTFRTDLAGFAGSAGWAEVGGKLIRQATYEGDPNPPVIGRTLWVPKAEWWGDYVRQHETGRLNATKAARAIEKALAGQPLGKAETRLVRWLHDYTQEQHRLEREEAEIYQSLAPKNQALLDRLAYDFIGQVGEAGPSMVSAMADDFAAQNPGAPPEKLNQLLIDELQAWMEG